MTSPHPPHSGAFDDGGTSPDFAPPVSTTPCTPNLLANTTVVPQSLLVDDTTLYWNDGNSQLASIPKSGGAPRTLAAPLDGPVGLAGDGNFLFWIDQNPLHGGDGTLFCISKSGGLPRALADTGSRQAFWLATDGVSVYWSDPGAGAISYVAADPGAGVAPAELAASPASPGAVATDGQSVYWLDANTLWALALPSGAPNALVDELNQPTALTIDTKNLYVQTAEGALAVDKVSGVPVPIAGVGASDGLHMYYFDAAGLERVAVGGGAIESVCAGARASAPPVVDGDAVYWAARANVTGGQLFSIAKGAL